MDKLIYQCWLPKRKAYLAGLKPGDNKILGVYLSQKDVKNGKQLRGWSWFMGIASIVLMIAYFATFLPSLYLLSTHAIEAFSWQFIGSSVFLMLSLGVVIFGAFKHSRLSTARNIKVRIGESKMTLNELEGTEYWEDEKPWLLLLESINKRIDYMRTQQTAFVKAAFTLALAFFVTLLLGAVFQELITIESALATTDPNSERAAILSNTLRSMVDEIPIVSLICIILTIGTAGCANAVWRFWLWIQGLPLPLFEEFQECVALKVANLEANALSVETKDVHRN